MPRWKTGDVTVTTLLVPTRFAGAAAGHIVRDGDGFRMVV